MLKRLAFLHEEDGAAVLETIALAAVVLILLVAAAVYLSGPGKSTVITEINGAVNRQINQWRSVRY
ncbi:MAG: hypothetical protein U0175_06785 [Caldilineaceae bacterium]